MQRHRRRLLVCWKVRQHYKWSTVSALGLGPSASA